MFMTKKQSTKPKIPSFDDSLSGVRRLGLRAFFLWWQQRISRGEFVVGYAVGGLFSLVPYVLFQSGLWLREHILIVWWVCLVLWFLGILWFVGMGVLLCIKRVHDIGRTWWLSVLLLIPLVHIAFAIWLCIREGDAWENAYGPDPLLHQPPTHQRYGIVSWSIFAFLLFMGLLWWALRVLV